MTQLQLPNRLNPKLAEHVLNDLAQAIYANATDKGFHEGDDPDCPYQLLARCALITSEVSEIVEEARLPEVDWDKVNEEIADVIIRALDLAHSLHLDIGAAVVAKMKKNEARPYKHGKRV
jgi:NTP pyrophosphatase (non-canonical NTP hydrolase)